MLKSDDAALLQPGMDDKVFPRVQNAPSPPGADLRWRLQKCAESLRQPQSHAPAAASRHSSLRGGRRGLGSLLAGARKSRDAFSCRQATPPEIGFIPPTTLWALVSYNSSDAPRLSVVALGRTRCPEPIPLRDG